MSVAQGVKNSVKKTGFLNQIMAYYYKETEPMKYCRLVREKCTVLPPKLALYQAIEDHELGIRSQKIRFNIQCVYLWLVKYQIMFYSGMPQMINEHRSIGESSEFSFQSKSVFKRNKFCLKLEKAFIGSLPISDFANEYDKDVERVLSSSYRKIDMLLDDNFVYEGKGFQTNMKNKEGGKTVVNRPLNDIVYDDIFEKLIKETEYIQKFSACLENHVTLLDQTKSLDSILYVKEEDD
ncbi:unnamed protein product [Moneuplotes crassus]|uniref:Uncharacterized protein n=1 Tax=Euplotes crassus TaxID=5936 RepID=A0AAD2D4J6_EUPCR|nr:unnamed protein product [Moneuplotes crassus]